MLTRKVSAKSGGGSRESEGVVLLGRVRAQPEARGRPGAPESHRKCRGGKALSSRGVGNRMKPVQRFLNRPFLKSDSVRVGWMWPDGKRVREPPRQGTKQEGEEVEAAWLCGKAPAQEPLRLGSRLT